MNSVCMNKTAKLITIALMLLVLSSAALAIGIVPATRIFEFKPGQMLSYRIDIVNNGGEDLEVILYARGDLAGNVRLTEHMIRLSKNETSKKANVIFTMPQKMDVAGQHTIEIVAVGSTPAPEGSETVVKADIAVISKLIIDVPYPEKYAEARIYVLDTEAGKPTTVTIPVFNKGKENIGAVHAEIKILNSEGAEVDSITTEDRAIKAGSDTKFSVPTNKPLQPGEYKALATVLYDGHTLELSTGFSVGELNVEIRSLVVDAFTLGDVAKFDILLYNAWSTELKGVYAEMQITDQDNKVYTDFKTVATDIQPLQIGRLEGYWYTQGVVPGIYIARITLHYANRVSQKMFELEVQPNAIIARPMGTGQAISAQDEIDFKSNAYLILIILVMATVIAVLAFRLRRTRQKPSPPEAAAPSMPYTAGSAATSAASVTAGTEGQEGGEQND